MVPTDDFDKRLGLFDAEQKRRMKEMQKEMQKEMKEAGFDSIKRLKDLAKMEKDHERLMEKMKKDHTRHIEKMKKYSERTDEIGRNKWNRRFLGLDKYGNAIHPRYMKNEKYHANNKKKEPKHIPISEPISSKKKSSNKKKLGIIFGVFILFYFAYEIISVVLKL